MEQRRAQSRTLPTDRPKQISKSRAESAKARTTDNAPIGASSRSVYIDMDDLADHWSVPIGARARSRTPAPITKPSQPQPPPAKAKQSQSPRPPATPQQQQPPQPPKQPQPPKPPATKPTSTMQLDPSWRPSIRSPGKSSSVVGTAGDARVQGGKGGAGGKGKGKAGGKKGGGGGGQSWAGWQDWRWGDGSQRGW